MNRNSIDNDVIILRKKQPPVKGEKAINDARRKGTEVQTQTKYGAASNKQHQVLKNTLKLEKETEELKIDTVPLDTGKLIAKGRQAKNLSQKDLATRINEKQQVIAEFESGRGVIRHDILTKIERELGIKLRGKDRGKPLAAAPTSTKK